MREDARLTLGKEEHRRGAGLVSWWLEYDIIPCSAEGRKKHQRTKESKHNSAQV